LKSEPGSNAETFMDILSGGEETTVFALYKGEPDYEKLIDLIFEHDHKKVISWW
jgi:hypothetical protein